MTETISEAQRQRIKHRCGMHKHDLPPDEAMALLAALEATERERNAAGDRVEEAKRQAKHWATERGVADLEIHKAQDERDAALEACATEVAVWRAETVATRASLDGAIAREAALTGAVHHACAMLMETQHGDLAAIIQARVAALASPSAGSDLLAEVKRLRGDRDFFVGMKAAADKDLEALRAEADGLRTALAICQDNCDRATQGLLASSGEVVALRAEVKQSRTSTHHVFEGHWTLVHARDAAVARADKADTAVSALRAAAEKAIGEATIDIESIESFYALRLQRIRAALEQALGKERAG